MTAPKFHLRAWPWVAGFAAVAALTLLTAADELGDWDGDAAHYILLGRELASGRGYADPVLPGDYPHTKYPFVFPALLAPAIWLPGPDLLAARTMTALLAALAVLAWAFAFRARPETASRAAPLAALFALNPYSFSFAVRALSETPYLLMSGLAVAGFARWERGRSRRDLALAVGGAVLAFYTRTAGVALLAAMTVAALAGELRKERLGRVPVYALMAVVFALAVGAWFGCGALHPSPVIGYFDELTRGAGPGRVWTNLGFYWTAAPAELLPVLKLHPLAAKVAAPAVWAVILLGAWLSWREGERLLPRYFFFAAVMLAAWAEYWDVRFAYPLLPAALLFGWRGLVLILGLLPQPRLAGWAAFGLFAGSYALSDAHFLAARYTPRPFPARPAELFGQLIEQPVIDWSETIYARELPVYLDRMGEAIVLQRLMAGLVPADAVIAAEEPRNTTLLTGRRAVDLPVMSDPDEALGYLEGWGVDYVIVDAYSRPTQLNIRPLIRSRPGRFELVVGDPAGTALYRLR